MAEELDDIIIDLTDLLEEGQPPQKAESPADPFDLAKELALSEEPKADDGVKLDVELTSKEEAALAEELLALDQPTAPVEEKPATDDLSDLMDAAVAEPAVPESAVTETQVDLLTEQPEAPATLDSASTAEEPALTPASIDEPTDAASQLIDLLENPLSEAAPAPESSSAEPPATADSASDFNIDELTALANEAAAQPAAADKTDDAGAADNQLLDLLDTPLSPAAEVQPSETADEAAEAAPAEVDLTAGEPEVAAADQPEPVPEAVSTEPPAEAVKAEPVEPSAEIALEPAPASIETGHALGAETLTAAAPLAAAAILNEAAPEPVATPQPAAAVMASSAQPHEKDALLAELKAEVPGLLAEVVRPLIASLAAEIVREARRKLPEVIEQVIREEIEKLKQLD